MQKAHDSSYNDYWKNKPNITTPIVQDQLNRIETTIDTIDDRVVDFDISKANQSDLLSDIKNVTFNPATGTFTFTRQNDTTIVIDTDIEKVVTNFDYDDNPSSPHYQSLVLTLDDGTVKYVDMSALVTEYDFAPSDTIQPTITSGTVSMSVKNGSITGEKLQPNYLADITVQANHAAASATASAGSATLSESWAIGGTGTREGEDTQNSKYYADLAEETVAELLAAFGIEVIGTRLIFGSTFEDQYEIEVTGKKLVITERV